MSERLTDETASDKWGFTWRDARRHAQRTLRVGSAEAVLLVEDLAVCLGLEPYQIVQATAADFAGLKNWAWVVGVLAADGLEPRGSLPSPSDTAVFVVEMSANPGAARVTVAPATTGSRNEEARDLGGRVQAALQAQGATAEGIPGQEPCCVFDVYPPEA